MSGKDSDKRSDPPEADEEHESEGNDEAEDAASDASADSDEGADSEASADSDEGADDAGADDAGVDDESDGDESSDDGDDTARAEKPATPEGEPFVERDHAATKMTYDHGGAPGIVIAVWAVALLGLAAYFISYGVPDLSAWGSP